MVARAMVFLLLVAASLIAPAINARLFLQRLRQRFCASLRLCPLALWRLRHRRDAERWLLHPKDDHGKCNPRSSRSRSDLRLSNKSQGQPCASRSGPFSSGGVAGFTTLGGIVSWAPPGYTRNRLNRILNNASIAMKMGKRFGIRTCVACSQSSAGLGDAPCSDKHLSDGAVP